jgi:hypothetical protein
MVNTKEAEMIAFLEGLLNQKSSINLYGAILLLKEKYGNSK